jgi:hypothetical protein
MRMESRQSYLARCARREREMAMNADDPCGYRRHIELARGYERQLLATAAHPDSSIDDTIAAR